MVEKTRARSLSRPRISLKPRQSKSNQPDETKLLHVSVTIQSLSGVYFKESTKSKNTNQTITVYPKTTIVATYSRDGTQDNSTIDDHIRSLPLDLSKPTGIASQEVATWLSSDKSTFTFEQYFQKDKKKKSRKKEMPLYMPQTCRVQLAICRNSRWFKLGDADIIIQGNEHGRVMAVPLINSDQPKMKKSKGNNVIPMARLKGETLKCGLGNNAKLSVVVNVSEYPKEKPNSNLALKKSEEEALPKVNMPFKAEHQSKEQSQLVGKGRMLQEQATNEPILKVDFQPIQETKFERLETITSSVAGSAAYYGAANREQRCEITKVAGLPPIRVNSTSSKSRSENILDQITAAVNEHSSQESQSANLHQPSTPQQPLAPVATRAGSVPIHLSPFRSLSSPHLMSEDSEPKTSILDQVVPIASDSTNPRQKSSYYFIQHDFQPTDDPSCTGLNKECSRDSLTVSTEKSSSQCDSIFNYSQSSGFTHSENSAFATASTNASGYSSSKTGTSQGEANMESVMAELLEKSPSELYAIMHDIDPGEVRMGRKEKSQRKESARIILEKKSDYESDLFTDNDSESYDYDYESAGESSFFYESDAESSIGSTFNSSYVSFAEKKRSRREKSFVGGIFGRACTSLCGIGRRGAEKTLSYVVDDETFVNGREYIDNIDDTWTSSTEGTKKRRSKWSRVE